MSAEWPKTFNGFKVWREPTADQPELLMDQVKSAVPQQVGLKTAEGVVFQVSLPMAIRQGVVREGQIKRQSIRMRDFVERVHNGH